jgi:hypothetical protein
MKKLFFIFILFFIFCSIANSYQVGGIFGFPDNPGGGTGTVEGTAVLSTGEAGGTKFLREDGDGTSSWQTLPAGGGDLTAIGDCATGDCFVSTAASGTIQYFWNPGGTFWTAIQGGNVAANRSWRLPIDAPPGAGLTEFLSIDENGQMLMSTYAEVQAHLSIDDLITLSGVAGGATHLGAFTGTTITDSSTIKTALQELETAVEGAGGGAATTEAAGIVELSTDAESVTGTSDVVVVTPGNLTARLASVGAIAGFTTLAGAGGGFAVDADGDTTVKSITVTASATPGYTPYDSDLLGADKTAGYIGWNAVTLTDGAEDTDLTLQIMQGGALTTVLFVDESDDQIELKKNLDLETNNLKTIGTIKGRMEIGPDITGSTAHDTTELHNTFNPFTAAATITLDAAADAGFGSVATYWIRDAGEAAIIDPQAGEKINLDGTALAAGTAITATGVGKSITIIAVTDTDGSGTDGYICIGNNGWASE